MNDYEYHDDMFVTCEKCGNDMAYLWFDRKEKMYLISCDNCGVNEREDGEAAQAEEDKQMLCCEGFKDFLNQELYIDENPRVY